MSSIIELSGFSMASHYWTRKVKFLKVRSEKAQIEVCVPECHFREHSLPGPNSVPAFGTVFFPSCLRSGNIREFPNASRMKINNFNFGALQDFPEWYPFVNYMGN